MVLALIWNRERYLDYRMEEFANLQEGAKNITKPTDASDENHYLIPYIFEVIYRLIFGSQLNILQILEKNPNLNGAILEALYSRTPWVNTTYKYPEYIGFLTSNYLTNRDPSNDTYTLADSGKRFLDYLRSNNIPLFKPNT